MWKYPTHGEVHNLNALMLAICGQTVYGYADETTAVALDLKTGAQKWAKPAAEAKIRAQAHRKQHSAILHGRTLPLATDSAYTIFDSPFQHFEAFAAADGKSLWNLSGTASRPECRQHPELADHGVHRESVRPVDRHANRRQSLGRRLANLSNALMVLASIRCCIPPFRTTLPAADTQPS